MKIKLLVLFHIFLGFVSFLFQKSFYFMIQFYHLFYMHIFLKSLREEKIEMVYRQDGWTKSDDEKLAKEVLKKIREGKTQLSAFQEVGERLNRTPSACGFRWNSTLRKIYADEIQAAKVERKMKKTHTKKALGMQIERLDFIPDPSFIESLKLKREKIENTDLEKLYGALCVLQKNYEDMLPILRQFEQVYAENERLRQKIFEMEKDFRMFILEFGMKNFLDK